MRKIKTIAEAEAELTDKIWHNLHLIRKWKIENHSIWLIEDGDTLRCGQKVITRSTWEGSLAAAKEIEGKYPAEGLRHYSDLDWGMMNGKLSALRWVSGQDWDQLYV